MPVIQIDFNETTDLYLQILRDAQFVEDKKLIRMVKERLKQNPCAADGPSPPVGEIIPFPCTGHPGVINAKDTTVIFREGFTHLMAIITIYLLVTITLVLIG